jgi:hypothetical protein
MAGADAPRRPALSSVGIPRRRRVDKRLGTGSSRKSSWRGPGCYGFGTARLREVAHLRRSVPSWGSPLRREPGAGTGERAWSRCLIVARCATATMRQAPACALARRPASARSGPVATGLGRPQSDQTSSGWNEPTVYCDRIGGDCGHGSRALGLPPAVSAWGAPVSYGCRPWSSWSPSTSICSLRTSSLTWRSSVTVSVSRRTRSRGTTRFSTAALPRAG